MLIGRKVHISSTFDEILIGQYSKDRWVSYTDRTILNIVILYISSTGQYLIYMKLVSFNFFVIQLFFNYIKNI